MLENLSDIKENTESIIKLIGGINLFLVILQFLLFSYLVENAPPNSFQEISSEVRLLLTTLPIFSSYLLTYLSFFL